MHKFLSFTVATSLVSLSGKAVL